MTGITRLIEDVIAFVLKLLSAPTEKPDPVLNATERTQLLEVAGQHSARRGPIAAVSRPARQSRGQRARAV